MALIIQGIPAFSDNYLWLFYQQGKPEAYVVDPGDAVPVIDTLKALSLKLSGVLVTHQHQDHIGGIPELLKLNPQLSIIGPQDIHLVNKPAQDGDVVRCLDIDFKVLAVPGHTRNHLAFYANPANTTPLVFCGDTLFAGGCGRLFEGTPEQMLDSLRKLTQLPDNTRIFCAHEYTQANLKFAETVEPENAELLKRIKSVESQRAANVPTVPSLLATEKATNPFLRDHSSQLKATVEKKLRHTLKTEQQVFTATRQLKDQF